MHVYLVRHGETFLAGAGIHQSPNSPLSPRGKEQSETVAESLRVVNPSLILSSGYTRAVETARVIGLHAGKPTQVHELFYEVIRPSSLYHKRLLSLATFRYVLYSFLNRNNPTWHYEDAENYHDLCERARKARVHLESLATKQSSVIVVSHAVFIRVLLSMLCEDRMPNIREMVAIFLGIARLPYTGVIHLVYEKTAPRSKTCAWQIVKDSSL